MSSLNCLYDMNSLELRKNARATYVTSGTLSIEMVYKARGRDEITPEESLERGQRKGRKGWREGERERKGKWL